HFSFADLEASCSHVVLMTNKRILGRNHGHKGVSAQAWSYVAEQRMDGIAGFCSPIDDSAVRQIRYDQIETGFMHGASSRNIRFETGARYPLHGLHEPVRAF